MDKEINESIRILVIEDDDNFRKTLVNLLLRKGYLAEGTGDSGEAIELAHKKIYDIILSDVKLPEGIDGGDVLLRIQDIQKQKIKMILMTGDMERYDPDRAKRLGMIGHLKKPFKMNELFDYIQKSVDELTSES